MRGSPLVVATAVAAAAVAMVVSPMGLTGIASGETHPVNPRTGVALSPCFSDDDGPPVIHSIHLSRSRVDVTQRSRTVEVVVHVEDTGGPGPASGVASVQLFAEPPQWIPGQDVPPLHRSADGTWRTTVTVPRLSTPEGWGFYAVAVDVAGNATEGLGRFGEVPDPYVWFAVASRPDERDPVVRRVLLSRRTVDAVSGRRAVRVRALVRDRPTGVRRVIASLRPVEGEGKTPEVRLRRVSGDPHRGLWKGTVVVPRGASPGLWEPQVQVYDRQGNVPGRHLDQRVAPLTLPRVRVRSVADDTMPEPTDLSMTPAPVDVRDGQRAVTIDVWVRDAGSGVASVELAVSPGTYQLREARLVSGTRYDGIWRVTTLISPCEWQNRVHAEVEVVTDRQGNRWWDSGYPPLVAADAPVLNVDRVQPTATTTLGESELRVAFDEDVVGISSTSAEVRWIAPYAGNPSSTVAGRWDCADSSGAAVDCLRGPLRTAVFTAERPFETAGRIFAALNDWHVYDITDLAGNPYGYKRRLTSPGGP